MYAEEEEEEEEGDACGVGEAHSRMTWQPPSPLSTSHTLHYNTYLPSLEVEEGSEVFPRLRATTKFKKDQDSRRECGGTTLTTLTTLTPGTTVTSGFVGAGRGKDGAQGEVEGVGQRAEVLQERELREEVQNLRIQLRNKCVLEPFLFFVSLSFGFGIDLVLAQTCDLLCFDMDLEDCIESCCISLLHQTCCVSFTLSISFQMCHIISRASVLECAYVCISLASVGMCLHHCTLSLSISYVYVYVCACIVCRYIVGSM